MAREFVISAGGITLAGSTPGQNTLIFLNPPATGPTLKILRIWISQKDIVASTQQRVQFVTQVTAFPTLTSATPRPLKRGDTTASVITGGTAGAAGTCGVNASAEGGGTKTVLWEDAFSVLSGFNWIPTPREVIELPPALSHGFGLYFPAAPGTLTNWSFGLVFAED